MLTKAPTGIKGFDDITKGSLPSGRTTLLMSEPGSGKTLFALRFLVHGAHHCKEPGIFVAFAEQSERIVANAAGFGWNLPELQRKNFYFLDARPSPDIIQSESFDLSGLPSNSGAAVSTPRRPSSRCGRRRCRRSLRRSRQRKRC